MARDSEPRKFFSEAPSRPLRSHISGSKKACNDSAEIEVDKQQQPLHTELHRAHKLVVFSDRQYTLGRLYERVLYANRLARHLSRFSPEVGLLMINEKRNFVFETRKCNNFILNK